MGTPSDALREYLDAQAAEKNKRFKEGVAKAAATRSANATKRKAKEFGEAGDLYHLHPADDPWSIKCRTLCGKVVPVKYALAPRMVATSTVLMVAGCQKCLGILAGWRLFHTKPLTFRRLNAWAGGHPLAMSKEEGANAMKQTLINALNAMMKCSDFVGYDLACDQLIGLLGLEEKRLSGEPDPDEAKKKRAFHVELVRLKLPPEVMKALRGA
jgi:hypothetical protein